MLRGDLPDSDLEADVTYVTTAEGGRKTPAKSGYRPTCDFGVPGVCNDSAHFFVGRTWVAPGESVLTKIHLISPESLKGRLHVGQSFEVKEGARVTARAVIVRLHNESLAKPPDS
jgi:translation elongation factor EF-Tu-like GTPase